MIEIRNIKVRIMPDKQEIQELEHQILKKLRLKKLPRYDILKRSLDARRKPDIFYIYQVGVYLENEDREKNLVKKINDKNIMLTTRTIYKLPGHGSVYCETSDCEKRPLIIGAGPAGLFCAYILALCGYAPIIAERGSMVEERMVKVNDYWNGKELDPECNVQFGEGGAGTFSDGKLNTQVKDKYGRIHFVLEEFVKHGASPEILYDNKPHIGTDVLVSVVSGMRKEIEELGGEFLFNTKVTDIEFEDVILEEMIADSDIDEQNDYKKKRVSRVKLSHNGIDTWLETNNVVLAIGHSARDTFSMLFDNDVSMVSKDFAMGVRIEHPENIIRQAMYGDGEAAKLLPTPPYKLTYQTSQGRGVYSFCMCPGGYVVNASSEVGYTAVNGMSYSGRNGANSNSALIVTVKREDYGSDDPLAGVIFQRKLEKAVFEQGKGRIVVQRYGDFKNNVPTKDIGSITPQTKGEYVCGNVAGCLPDFIRDAIVEAMPAFDKDIPGFANDDAVMSGVESRTSSPVRILRGKDLQSENIEGLYPCGEGAGYAGGIMSAAMDGMKVAEAIIANRKE